MNYFSYYRTCQRIDVNDIILKPKNRQRRWKERMIIDGWKDSEVTDECARDTLWQWTIVTTIFSIYRKWLFLNRFHSTGLTRCGRSCRRTLTVHCFANCHIIPSLSQSRKFELRLPVTSISNKQENYCNIRFLYTRWVFNLNIPVQNHVGEHVKSSQG